MAGSVGGKTADIVVRGRAELEAAFAEVRLEVFKEMKPALLLAAEPVKTESYGNIVQSVRNIGPRWSQFKIGANVRGVWVAPKVRAKGTGTPRPNLGTEMLEAMSKAVEDKQEEVVAAVEVMVDTSIVKAGLAL